MIGVIFLRRKFVHLKPARSLPFDCKDPENKMEAFNVQLKALDKELEKCSYMIQIEQVTGVKKSLLTVGAGALVFVLILLNIWANLITNLIGFLYPAYASFRAIETKDKNDDKQWLTYWYEI
jgi:receptor expression-enhancing protein 5/6